MQSIRQNARSTAETFLFIRISSKNHFLSKCYILSLNSPYFKKELPEILPPASAFPGGAFRKSFHGMKKRPKADPSALRACCFSVFSASQEPSGLAVTWILIRTSSSGMTNT